MSNSSTTIIGNLTRDPDVRYLPSGTPVADLGVAVNKSWKNKDDEWQEEVSFFQVSAFRDLAEQAVLLEKGVRVVVTGDLKQESWETDQGEKRSAIKLVARDIAVSVLAMDGFDRRVREERETPSNTKKASSPKKSSNRKFDDDSDEPF